jgi:hypothetical protein
MNKTSKIVLSVLFATLIGVLAMALSTASAAALVRIAAHPDLSFVDPDDDEKPIETVGIDVAADEGGLTILLTKEGEGALGDASVPCYNVDDLPEDALERIMPDAAACWLCVARPYPGGATFRLTSTAVADLIATAMRRLAEIGCEVGTCAPGEHEFCFTCAGSEFRAVFSADEGGTLVYLGR